ncbi:MAG: molybdate ABC transporter substrate-binding protein [Woeseiaceae bacterium]|nr:molybdate ABC transporter substrate-binding protein [Woeseiaceae bacterium]
MRGRLHAPLLLLTLLASPLVADDVITVAVASNFATTARELADRFTQQSEVPVRLSYGSTGKLYAQIINGAPFDVFLAADVARPMLLEGSGHSVAGMRFTYATGSLTLWSADARLKARDCRDVLIKGDFRHLALANPITAPYGKAARDVLMHLQLWDTAYRRIVFGENIAQALQFTATRNATLGFIARSQTLRATLPAATCSWQVPATMHDPIEQQLVLLSRAAGNTGAQRFLEFMRSPAAHEIIVARGYGVSR